MLVSYKWLKQLVDVDVPSEELAEKCQPQGSKGVSPLGLSKNCRREVLSCEDGHPKHTYLCKLMWVKKRVKSSVEHQMCEQASDDVVLGALRIANNYKVKRKIRGLESLGMILVNCEDSDSIVPKKFAGQHVICYTKPVQVRSLLLSRLWMMKSSKLYHSKPCRCSFDALELLVVTPSMTGCELQRLYNQNRLNCVDHSFSQH